MTLTAKDVAEITRLLEESSFDEMTLELDGLKLTLRRNGAAASAGTSAPEAPQPKAAPAAKEPVPSAPPAQLQEAAPAPGAAGMHDIPAPLLGTFYRAPKPGAPPFIEVGSDVEEGTIIGIIEVMKLMNTVRAGVRGKVAQIVAEDGALVEYGATLVRVTKATPA